MKRPLPLLLLLVTACNDGDEERTPPDLTGTYNFILEGGAGCGLDAWTLDWLNSTMRISGEPGDLDVEFPFVEPPVTFPGTVSNQGSISFSGPYEIVHDEVVYDLIVTAAGVAQLSGETGRYQITGDVDAERTSEDDPEPCTREGTFVASNVSAT